MMIDTVIGKPVEATMLSNYFKSLVNQFFKILPIRENEELSLTTYMRSLQIELLGCEEFVIVFKSDEKFITLLSILQYLIDNPDTPVPDVTREVFRAINICNKLKKKYSEGEVS